MLYLDSCRNEANQIDMFATVILHPRDTSYDVDGGQDGRAHLPGMPAWQPAG
jgi:hypothetical protein